MNFGLEYLKSNLRAARSRYTFSSPEVWFMLAALLITISWIFNSFIGLPETLNLSILMGLIKGIVIFIMYGFVIYLTALLSLYLDERMKLSEDSVMSSNFNFTRLFTPVARAILLLSALLLITSAVPSLLQIYTFVSGFLAGFGIPLPTP